MNVHIPSHNYGTFFLWITEGIPIGGANKVMPPFKDQLTEEERWHIVNYLRHAHDLGSIEPGPPPEVATG